jgi:hypothetical protein
MAGRIFDWSLDGWGQIVYATNGSSIFPLVPQPSASPPSTTAFAVDRHHRLMQRAVDFFGGGIDQPTVDATHGIHLQGDHAKKIRIGNGWRYGAQNKLDEKPPSTGMAAPVT